MSTDRQPLQPTQATPATGRPAWMRLLGLRRRNGRLLRFGLTRWGGILLGLMVVGGGTGGLAGYSMKPAFCRSCHLMEPYYQSWARSSHGGVSCADCHFEPGFVNGLKGKMLASSQVVKYFTGTYGSKPHAEVRDASCLRPACHDLSRLNGPITWKVKTARGTELAVRFDHRRHLKPDDGEMNLRCVSCHGQATVDVHMAVTAEACFLCHLGRPRPRLGDTLVARCKACHEAPKSQLRLSTGLFDHGDYTARGVTCENCHSDSVKGVGDVAKQVCWACHNQPAYVARYGQTGPIHHTHVSAHKVECFSCHTQVEHSLNAQASGRPETLALSGLSAAADCAPCHTQTHAGPAALYAGIGGRGVPEMASPMSRTQVDCVACHHNQKRPADQAAVLGQTFQAAQASCARCHGNKYPTRLQEWREALDGHVQRAQDEYDRTKAAAGRAGIAGLQERGVAALLEDARHNLELVRLGRGIHNVNYSTALLNVVMDRCRLAADILHGETAVGAAAP